MLHYFLHFFFYFKKKIEYHRFFFTESLEPPVKYGKLEQFSEIHVADTAVNKKDDDSNENGKKTSHIANNLLSAFNKFLPITNDRNSIKRKDEAIRNYELLHSFSNRKLPTICRVHPMPKMDTIEGNMFDEIARCPYHVFVPSDQASEFLENFGIARIKKLPEDKQYVNITNTNFLVKDESPVPNLFTELIVRVYTLEDLLEKTSKLNEEHFNINLRHKSVYVSDSLRISLKLKVGAKVSLTLMDRTEISVPSSLELFSWRDSVSVKDFEDYVKKYSLHNKLLINSCAVIVMDNGSSCIVKISSEDCKFAVIDEATLRDTRVRMRSVEEKDQFRVFDKLDQEYSRLEKTYTR